VDICGPKWPAHEPKARISRGLESTNSVLHQHFSRVERVTGIEPALSAWVLTVRQGTLAKMAKGTRSGTGAVSDVNERRSA